MIVFWVITISVGFLYLILILSFLYGWVKQKNFVSKNLTPSTFLSVIIAARNEEENIQNIIDDILNQDLDKSNFELIIVNDHSEDKTNEIVEKISVDNSNVRLINLTEGEFGKKAAIHKGILNSNGSLIVTSDADCRAGEKWLRTILSFYQEFKSKMIVGPVKMRHNSSLFQKFQSLEFAALISSGAGAIGIGKPIMCNGANLVYEKEAYLSFVNPLNSKYSSGDDVLLMQNVKKKFPDGIRFLKSKDAIVETHPQKNILSFLSQRKRWASKAPAYKDFHILLSGLIVSLISFLTILSIVLGVVNYEFFYCGILLFTIKTIVDFIFLFYSGNFFNSKSLSFLTPLMQLYYLIYVPLVLVLSFSKKYNWKDRRIK